MNIKVGSHPPAGRGQDSREAGTPPLQFLKQPHDSQAACRLALSAISNALAFRMNG